MSALGVDRKRRAYELRAQGLTQQEIAHALGVSRSSVSAYLDPLHGEKTRQRRARYGRACVDCGTLTSGAEGRAKAPERCAACQLAKQHNDRYWTRERIVDAIRLFAKRNGRAPVATDWLYGWHGIGGDGYPYTTQVLRECGSWANAVEAAGFPRPYVGHKPRGVRLRVSTLDLIRRVRDASEQGLAPSSGDPRVRGTYIVLRRRGISWSQACTLAGVRPRHKRRSRVEVAA